MPFKVEELNDSWDAQSIAEVLVSGNKILSCFFCPSEMSQNSGGRK